MGSTVYFAGSEYDVFTGTHEGHTTTGVDTSYVRGGVQTKSNKIAYASLISATPSNNTDGYWLHFRKYQNSNTFRTKTTPLTLYASDGSLSFQFYNVDNGGVQARLYANNNSYVSSGTSYDFYAEITGVVSTTIAVDIHVFTNADGKAEAHVYQNGHRKITVVNTNGYHRGLSYVALSHVSDAGVAIYSEVIAADFDPRKLRLGTYYPSADGYYNDGTGSYADVDELAPDGAVVTLSNTGEKKSYAVAKYGSPATGTIISVLAHTRARTIDDTVDMQVGLLIDSQDYFSSKLALSGSLANVQRSWSANPAGGSWPSNLAGALELIHTLVVR